MTPRFALKAATDAAHQRLDALLDQLKLGDRGEYATFLTIHAAVLPPLENALDRGGLPALLPNWEESRRAAALAADLADLGIADLTPVPIKPLSGIPDVLGAAYTLEGSRLGARVLIGRAGPRLPTQFLAHRGNERLWVELTALLNEHLRAPQALARAIKASNDIFDAYFVAAGQRGLEG